MKKLSLGLFLSLVCSSLLGQAIQKNPYTTNVAPQATIITNVTQVTSNLTVLNNATINGNLNVSNNIVLNGVVLRSATVSNAAALTSGQFVIGQGAGGVATTLNGNALTNLNGTNLNAQGASAGQILTATATGVAFSNAPAGGGGSGSVSNVAFTGPAGFTVTGSPITGSGTIALTAPGLVITQGFTGVMIISNDIVTSVGHKFLGDGSSLTNINTSATNLGALTFATNAGNVSLVNLPVSAASAGTVEAYGLQLAGTNMLEVYGVSDATTITNPFVRLPLGNLMVHTNALSSWPKVPTQAGAFAIVSSNGLPYMLLSTNNAGGGSATWTGTNKLGW